MDRKKKLGARKRQGETLVSPSKHSKYEESRDNKYEDKNFQIACEQVSLREYYDCHTRFQLVYLPSCVTTTCNHKKYGQIKQIPTYAEESFMTEIRNHEWYDALEMCHMCLTSTQYLSFPVLQEIVEIMLNVHEDKISDYSASYIVNICQQILLQNFSTHPPCLDINLRECYVKFLTSEMPSKKHTATNRSNYEHNQGIVKYCMNRLECELSVNSTDGPLVDTYIPDDLKDSIKGFTYQKLKYEIFESLKRGERIERLLTVLETIIEVLQFDSAIALSRYANDQNRHMRSVNKLMEHVLRLGSATKVISGECLQIIRLFANMVHLRYPEMMLKTITAWLNLTVQTVYIRGPSLNSDYPKIHNQLVHFGIEFLNIIADKPPDSIVRILERIEPKYMRHIVGILYVRQKLDINDSCIFDIVKDFVASSQWESHCSTTISLSKVSSTPKNVSDKISYLLSTLNSIPLENTNVCVYPKKELTDSINNGRSVSIVERVHILYIILQASLEELNLQSVEETWNSLNKQLVNENISSKYTNRGYTVSSTAINEYKIRFEKRNDLGSVFKDLKVRGQLPPILSIFENIELLKLRV